MKKKTRPPEIPDPPVVYPFPYSLCRTKPPLEEQIAEAIAILKGEHYPHFYFLEWTPSNHPDRFSGFVTDLVALKDQPDHPLAPFLARLLELIRKKFSPADLALPKHSAKTAVPAMFYSLDNAFIWLVPVLDEIVKIHKVVSVGSRVIAGAKEAPHPDKKNRVLLIYLKGVLRKNKGQSSGNIWDSLKAYNGHDRDPLKVPGGEIQYNSRKHVLKIFTPKGDAEISRSTFNRYVRDVKNPPARTK